MRKKRYGDGNISFKRTLLKIQNITLLCRFVRSNGQRITLHDRSKMNSIFITLRLLRWGIALRWDTCPALPHGSVPHDYWLSSTSRRFFSHWASAAAVVEPSQQLYRKALITVSYENCIARRRRICRGSEIEIDRAKVSTELTVWTVGTPKSYPIRTFSPCYSCRIG